MRKLLIISPLLLLPLTGCALLGPENEISTSYIDPVTQKVEKIETRKLSNKGVFYDSKARVHEAKAELGKKQVEKINENTCPSCTPSEQALLASNKILGITMVGMETQHVEDNMGDAPKDGYDFWFSVAERNQIPLLGNMLMSWGIVDKILDNPMTSIQGETVDISDAFNKFEAHSTNSSYSPFTFEMPWKPETTISTIGQ